jgi:hypothetical protein
VISAKKKKIDSGSNNYRISYVLGIENVIVPVLVHLPGPLHPFDCLWSKLKSVSCALACCIGSTTTTAADSIATAASTATITNVELSILSSFEYLY